MRQAVSHALLGTLAAFLAACGSAPSAPSAAASATTASAPAASGAANQYANADNWLCLPGRTDACSVSLDAALFAKGGAPAGRETYRPAAAAPGGNGAARHARSSRDGAARPAGRSNGSQNQRPR